jgi:hypothetical protein
MSDHVKTLEPKIHKLHDSLGKLTARDSKQELLTIIHRPGWTTLPEAQLVHAMLDSLNQHVDAVHTAHRALIAAANQIGKT